MAHEDVIEIGVKLEVVSLLRDPDNNYFSYIKDFNAKEVLIDVPSKNHKQGPFHVKDKIKIIITNPEAIYKADTFITRNQFMPIAGLWILKPKDFERVQRRAFLRVPIKLIVNTTMIDKDGDKFDFNIETRDLSAGGISFNTDEDLNIFVNIGKFYITFALPNDKEKIKTECELVFCRPNPPNSKLRFIAAFKYVNLDPKVVDKIFRFCFNYQVELKRKGLL